MIEFMRNEINSVIVIGLGALLISCASQRTEEIGDPGLTSPEEHHHYTTIYDAFSRHDTNGDGYLDRHEYTQLQGDAEILRVQKAIEVIVKSGPLLFEEIDENEDELISLNELTIMIQPLLPVRQ